MCLPGVVPLADAVIPLELSAWEPCFSPRLSTIKCHPAADRLQNLWAQPGSPEMGSAAAHDPRLH
jgi:hypothetical protein